MRPVDAIFNPNPIAQHDCRCIKRVQVVTQPRGGNLIAWEVSPGFSGTGPFCFYVDWAHAGDNAWQPLSDIPVVDDCVCMDVRQHNWDQLSDYSYRVRLVLPNDIDPATKECRFCVSQPQQANGLWSKRDWLIAREIARKELLYQAKRVNVTATGLILKRKRWGQRCKNCTEFDTGEVQTRCLQCYSTGFVGGYFKAIDFTVTTEAPWDRAFKRDETVGVTNNIVKSGRALAYPFLDTNDIFIRRDSGERYYVHSIKQAAEVGGVPIIVMVELKLAPVTDIAYDVPLTGTASSSSSSSQEPVPACDVKTGLHVDSDW